MSTNPHPSMQPLAVAIRDIGILWNAKQRSTCRDRPRLSDAATAAAVRHDHPSPETASRQLSTAAKPTAECLYFVKCCEMATCPPNCPRLANATAAATSVGQIACRPRPYLANQALPPRWPQGVGVLRNLKRRPAHRISREYLMSLPAAAAEIGQNWPLPETDCHRNCIRCHCANPSHRC